MLCRHRIRIRDQLRTKSKHTFLEKKVRAIFADRESQGRIGGAPFFVEQHKQQKSAEFCVFPHESTNNDNNHLNPITQTAIIIMLAMNPSTIDLTQDQNPSTIDLTQDIQDDHELLPEPPSTVDLTQDVKDNEALPAEPLHLGTFNFNIVGTRYYKGECHSGEFVGLVREPSNPCDRNAIRIDNLRGEKVGHIKKDEALSLSKIMDQYRHIIMDGTIPGGGDQRTIPLQIDFYGTDPALAKTIVAILKPARTHLSNSKYAPAVAAAAAAVTAFPFTAPAPILVQKYTMNWTVQQKDLDDMFDAQSKKQLEGLPLVPTPPTLVTELMEHQVIGLRWMVRNEVNPPLVPFFKEVKQHLGRTMWFSEITNSSQSEPPKPIRGGILADGMYSGSICVNKVCPTCMSK
jgi:hypothetical protein